MLRSDLRLQHPSGKCSGGNPLQPFSISLDPHVAKALALLRKPGAAFTQAKYLCQLLKEANPHFMPDTKFACRGVRFS
jgi:hypothetical protein